MTTISEYRERKDRLVAALRSGEYQQTTGVLRHENSYCCLGVACDLADVGAVGWIPDTGTQAVFAYAGEIVCLPHSVERFYGFTSNVGDFWERGVGGNPTTLVHMNDSGKSFSKIADLIDSEPPGLFTWSGEK